MWMIQCFFSSPFLPANIACILLYTKHYKMVVVVEAMPTIAIAIKSFLHLSHQCRNHLAKKNHLWYQIYSSGVNNDDIHQCEHHQSTKQCQHADEKIKQKVIKKHGLTPKKYETLHFSQWTQKKSKWHQGIQSFPQNGHNERNGSPWGLTIGHRCNVSNQEPKDGGGLI
jgi:hypothetical protein